MLAVFTLAAAFGINTAIFTTTAQLYEVSAQNPLLLLGMTLVLCSVGLIVRLVPARLAALIDPIQALRIE